MGKTKTAATHAGICAVCFNEHKLDSGTDRPTRHGFSAHNVRHGVQHGGWHSGPCFGTSFPHYGISTEGTKAALAQAENTLKHVNAAIEAHSLKPALTWVRKGQKGGAWGTKVSREYTVQPGARETRLDPESAEGFNFWDSIPSYDDLWERIQRNLNTRANQITDAIVFLNKMITEWKLTPAKELDAAKGPVVHFQRMWKNRGNYPTGSCQMFAMRPPSIPATRLTTDWSKVTCQRCLKDKPAEG